MIELLRNKNLATRFQILIEIAANQPTLQQREIAAKLGITSQAISEYVKELIQDGWLVTDGRSKYRITKEGVNWVLKTFRDLRNYSLFAGRAITNIAVCTAIAEGNIAQGQTVGLRMKQGMLYATLDHDPRAKGVATSAASSGEDVGVSQIEGIVDLVVEKVMVLRIPGIQKGGSRGVDLARLDEAVSGLRDSLGAVGIESVAALRRLQIEPRYLYGVTEAAIEAARSGLPFIIVCTEDDAPALLARLSDASVEYELQDLRLKQAREQA